MSIVCAELLNVWLKCLRLGIFYHEGMGKALAGNHAEYGSLGLDGTSLSICGFLGLMLVGLPAAEIHFIQFHLTFKCDGIILSKKSSHLMENESCGLLRDVQVSGQLV